MTDTTEPSVDELAAANAILARAAAVQAAKVNAVAPSLKAVVAEPGFAALLASATAARDQLSPGMPLHAHLNAVVIGMTNLEGDVAKLDA